jgi:hypothetical protein
VPLWLNRPPAWAEPRWRELKVALTNVQEDWQVWTTWYDDRLAGKVNPIEREVAYVDVPDELWKQDPAAVNKELVRRIEERESSLAHVDGRHNIVVQAIGSGNNVSVDPRIPHLRLTQFEARTKRASADGLDAALLSAYRTDVVPFVGRDGELADLQRWIDSDRVISVRVLTGAGGRGKTRLALELVRKATEEGWQAGFVEHHELDRFRAQQNVAEWAWDKPTLIVVDYAATRVDQLRDWIGELVNASIESGQPRFRMLLLERQARPASGWLASVFGHGHDDRSRAASSLLDPPQPVELAAIDDRKAARSLEPPDVPLPPPSPATRFTFTNGRFDIASSHAWRDREAQAGAYHSRARTLAAGLTERLSRTDAVPDVAGSVEALLDVLGESVAEVQPDLLRLASRSIAARARAYGHPAAQWEISADSVGAFFELADVLVDLQTFVRTDLEAHEQAVRELDLTPEKAADAKIALDLVTDAILSAPEVISETAQTAFEAAAEVSQTAADRDVKVAVEGDRTLLTTNLVLAVARELARDKEAPTADHEAAVQTGAHPPGELSPQEPGPKAGEPEKRKTRTRRTKAAGGRAGERSWQEFADRVAARIYDKGPNRIADATLDALTGIVRHSPKTVIGLGAALVLWAAGSPIVAGGALATTIGWISYELRRKSKKSK